MNTWGGLFVSGVEVQLEDEHQNMDSHNNENEVEGGGKAFVVVNMEDNLKGGVYHCWRQW